MVREIGLAIAGNGALVRAGMVIVGGIRSILGRRRFDVVRLGAAELMTMPGGKHGFDCCTAAQRTNAYVKIREFLARHHVLGAPAKKPKVREPEQPNTRGLSD